MIDLKEVSMAVRRIKSKKFKTKAEAQKWAKSEKSKISSKPTPKWETNRLTGRDDFNWEAVVYRET